MLPCGTPHEEGGVDARENFVQRQGNRNPIALDAGSKYLRRRLTDIAKGDVHQTLRKLGENLIERDCYRQITDGLDAHLGAEFSGEAAGSHHPLDQENIVGIVFNQKNVKGTVHGSLAFFGFLGDPE